MREIQIMHPKANTDFVANKHNMGKEIFLWKCKYNHEHKHCIPLSTKLSNYDETPQDPRWWHKASIQRSLARNELVLDLDTRRLVIQSIRKLRRGKQTFVVWGSGRKGAWIRTTSKELGMLQTRRDRDDWRKLYYAKYGGEIKTERTLCPAEYSTHHKSLKQVLPERMFENGVEIEFVLKKERMRGY